MSDKALDWTSWAVSNLVIGALLPLFGMLVMHGLKKIFKSSDIRVSYTAPFRDGQLGFIAVGWVVAALVEIIKWSVKHNGMDMIFYIITLCICAFFSALVAAAGAVSPVETAAAAAATGEAAAKTPAKGAAAWKTWLFDTYPAFTYSVVLCVLTFPLAGIVHGKTS